MAKYYGLIGYGFNVETAPGVWENHIEEKVVYGDITRNVKRTENSGQVNDNISINNQISFIADPYAMNNFHTIKYATYMGCKWSVVSVEPAFPRLLLNLGGVYNDEQQTCSS